MPISRAQEIAQNECRIKAIDNELSEISTGQASSTSTEEQAAFLARKASLGSERRVLDNVCQVLRTHIEEAEREKEAQNAQHWEEEKVTYEQEFEKICGQIETRLINTKKLYDDLMHAENRAKEQWKRRGMPGTPARTQSRRTLAGFLGVESTRQIGTSTGRRKRLAKLFSAHSSGGR